MPECRPGERTLVWHHWLEEWMLAPESGIELPATFIYPARDNWRGGALLYFDEGNRWADLRGQGMLASLTHFADKDTSGPAILTVELRGWGDTKPANAPYDVAGWADRERWVSYVSAALGDSIFSMRVRDGLSALAYLAAKENIEPGKIIVAGRGAGAVVAMHVAALAERCKLPAAGLIALEPLGSFEQLATAREYAWSHETFYPGVLVHYDLPELVRSLKIPALILNPLDAAKARMGGKAAAELYGPTEGSTMEVKAELDGTAALKAAGAFISARMER
jgi:hypothetical protein